MIMELRRILLVEDDPNDAELTLKGLRPRNLANQLDWVKDGEEALDYIFKRGDYAERPNGQPSVVILDIHLPKLSGLEVLAEIRKNPATSHLPVVILTSSREEQDLARGYELGVNGYVVKPVRFGEFIEAIEHLGLFWAVVNQGPSPTATA